MISFTQAVYEFISSNSGCGRLIAWDRYRRRRWTSRRLFHLLPQAQRAHISPNFFNIFQTFLLQTTFADILPAKRILSVGGPYRILLFVIHNDLVDGSIFLFLSVHRCLPYVCGLHERLLFPLNNHQLKLVDKSYGLKVWIRVQDSSLVLRAKGVRGIRLAVMFQILFTHLFGHLPTVAYKYPRAQKCRPQMRFSRNLESQNLPWQQRAPGGGGSQTTGRLQNPSVSARRGRDGGGDSLLRSRQPAGNEGGLLAVQCRARDAYGRIYAGGESQTSHRRRSPAEQKRS